MFVHYLKNKISTLKIYILNNLFLQLMKKITQKYQFLKTNLHYKLTIRIELQKMKQNKL